MRGTHGNLIEKQTLESAYYYYLQSTIKMSTQNERPPSARTRQLGKYSLPYVDAAVALADATARETDPMFSKHATQKARSSWTIRFDRRRM